MTEEQKDYIKDELFDTYAKLRKLNIKSDLFVFRTLFNNFIDFIFEFDGVEDSIEEYYKEELAELEDSDEPSIEELENDEYWDNVLSPQVDYLNRM